MEQEIGADLLDRTADTFTLTAVGEAFANMASEVVMHYHAFEAQLVKINEKSDLKTLSILISPNMMSSLSLPLKKRLTEELPSYGIRISESIPERIQANVAAGSYDLAILPLSVLHTKLEQMVIKKIQYGFYPRENCPLRSEIMYKAGESVPCISAVALSKEPFIVPVKGGSTRALFDEFCLKHALFPFIYSEASQAENYRQVLKSGEASAFLPIECPLFPNEEYWKIDSDFDLTLSISMVFRKGHISSSILKKVYQCVTEILA